MEDDDKSSKTEEPSARKLSKAREKGNVPKSKEVNSLFALIGLAAAVGLTLPIAMHGVLNMYGGMLQEAGTMRVTNPMHFGNIGELLMGEQLAILLPTLLILMVVGLFGGFIQTGPIWSSEPLKPKMSKISLIKGFERLFSLKSFAEFLKSIFKLVVIGWALFGIIYLHREDFLLLSDQSVFDGVLSVQKVALQMLAAVIFIMFILAAMDFLFQKSQYHNEQKMSFKELRDEMKETEGDPHIKQRQRQIRQERAMQRMMQEVPKADVIITNPTHYSIALQYNQAAGQAAPKVLAKGMDHLAMKIREIARENDIPFYEDPPLARQIYADVEIDHEIPLELYEAVAKVIGYVMSLKKKNKKAS